MEALLEVCPFTIKRLQTDNGIEFTFRWISQNADEEKAHPLKTICESNNIVHKLIPPAEKELQGLVERSHRQDDQELYTHVNPQTLEEFSDQLDFYYKQRNAKRRFKKLGWITPDNYLENFTASHIAHAWSIMDKKLLAQINDLEESVA